MSLEKWQPSLGSYGPLNLQFAGKRSQPSTVLCLGAHSDDIEIGCGGTLLQLKKSYGDVRFHWVVFCAAGTRAKEAAAAASAFTGPNKATIVIKDFRDGYLPYTGAAVKDLFEELKTEVQPDLIFTHWQGDAHQDHRLVSELTWNTFRNHLILEYEIPKYDGDLGRPNVFLPLDAGLAELKVDYLFDAFKSQQSKPWFDRNTFMGLMRIRGMESNAPSGYAEAFYARKIVLG